MNINYDAFTRISTKSSEPFDIDTFTSQLSPQPTTTLHYPTIEAFAADNGFTYTPFYPSPAYEGFYIFNAYKSKKLYVASPFLGMKIQNTNVTIGNYIFAYDPRPDADVDETRFANDYETTVIDISLPVAVTHTILLSVLSSWAWDTPIRIKKSQQLKLEGDFNNYFKVFTPNRQETATLNLLTPDVMAALEDHALEFDIEAIGQHLYLYINHINLQKEEKWRSLFTILEALIPEIERQARSSQNPADLAARIKLSRNNLIGRAFAIGTTVALLPTSITWYTLPHGHSLDFDTLKLLVFMILTPYALIFSLTIIGISAFFELISAPSPQFTSTTVNKHSAKHTELIETIKGALGVTLFLVPIVVILTIAVRMFS